MKLKDTIMSLNIFSKQNFKNNSQNIKKGISPIVASVLLIAFSTAIAAIVGTWATSYTESKLTTMESCQNINLIAPDFDYNSTTKEGSLVVQNTGGKVGGYRVYAFGDNNQRELIKEISGEIEKNDRTTINFEITLNNPKGLTVEAVNCPGVRLSIPITS